MPDPYYADDKVTLYLGDCREITEWLRADVLVTDPPYGMNYQSGQRTQTPQADRIVGDDSPVIRDTALEAWGKTRPAIVFGTWRVPPPRGERQRLIWWKRGGGPGMGDLLMPWGTTHEDVHILGDGWDRTETATPRGPSVITTETGMGSRNGIVARYEHPTAKPVALMETLIRVCPPGVIADPFAGSGSTLVAARNLGRRAIGVELEERYCEVAARRLAQDCLDLNGHVMSDGVAVWSGMTERADAMNADPSLTTAPSLV
jgi:hypothetical protein